ncbi:WD repeat-containing protein [Pimephales promelas]|nr:WD repeat-containing protein [Pimephales promelas]
MAAPTPEDLPSTHVEKKSKKKVIGKRYWEETKNTEQKKPEEEPSKDVQNQNKAPVKERSLKRKKGESVQPVKEDPFPGQAPIPTERLQKFRRGEKHKTPAGARRKLKEAIVFSESVSELAQKQAARYDLLLPEDAG